MAGDVNYRPTKATVNLSAITGNVKELKDFLPEGTGVIAVVKADGYGHGALQTAQAAFDGGAAMCAVATPDEAIRLREEGLEGEILVLGSSPVSFAARAAEEQITVTVFEADWLEQASARMREDSPDLHVHIKVDTGMGRIGVRSEEELLAIYQVIANERKLSLCGMFTHFARADEEERSHTAEQYELFMRLVRKLPEKPPLLHAAGSAAAMLYPDYALDAVRYGISLYGIPPSAHAGGNLPFGLKRAMTVETELAYVKKLPAGSPVSYGGTYVTETDEWIGTLPVGYADGLRRGLRGQEVLIRGRRMPIVGTICMDQCMVRLDREYAAGEPVVLIGTQGGEEVKMEEWAERLGTIPYEIAVSFSPRLPRIYSR